MKTEMDIADDIEAIVTSSNPLLAPLGDIPTRKQIVTGLKNVPPLPDHGAPPEHWPYLISCVEHLFVPDSEMIRCSFAIDRLIRLSLSGRIPDSVELNRQLYMRPGSTDLLKARELAMLVTGISGAGKTAMVLRSLGRYPRLFLHDSLPGFEGEVQQLVWLYVVVPAKCSLKKLATELIRESAVMTNDPDLPELLSRGANRDPSQLFANWCQWAKGKFLGMLVLDEVENFFTLRSVKERQTGGKERLKVADDEALRKLLSFINTSGTALAMIGTPDAEHMLNYRASITQRIAAGGHYQLDRFTSPQVRSFSEALMPRLAKYQFGEAQLSCDATLCETVFKLTAGIRRLIRDLWIHAHIVASEKQEALRIEHISHAASAAMRPVSHLVRGIIAGDADAISQYEDLQKCP